MISEILINRPDKSGELRIREKHTDNQGREYIKSYNCPNISDVNALLATHATEIQLRIEEQDANEAAETDIAIAINKESSIKQVALAYLRKAMLLDDPYRAYIKFDRFNTYRISQGWSVSQVVVGLSDVGLTSDEWDSMLARYQYLSDAGRLATMEAYQLVLAGDNF